MSCAASPTPEGGTPVMCAGQPSEPWLGPIRRRRRMPNRLVAKLGNRLDLVLLFRSEFLQSVSSLGLFILVIGT